MWWRCCEPLGSRGERLAARHLRRLGYSILARSWRCPAGELDVIAQRGDLVIVAEVKTRADENKGEPWQAVDARKRKHITRATVFFLKSTGRLDLQVRFDVIAITWPPGWFAKPVLRHFESAFEAEGPWNV